MASSRCGIGSALVVLFAAGMLAGASVTPALAAPRPSPGHGVFPSQHEVEAAKARAVAAAAEVRAAQARFDAASAQLVAIEQSLSVAVAAYGEAQDRLAGATARASQAADLTAAATQRAEAAERVVRRSAALVYEQATPNPMLEAFLSSGGPQDLADLDTGLTAISARQVDAYATASSSANEAAADRALADRARVQQADATEVAHRDEQDVQAKAMASEHEVAALTAQQNAAVAMLAKLRRTSAAVEKSRQEGLAAEAARRAAAARAAAADRAARARAATRARSSGHLYASGGGAGLTAAQLNPKPVARSLMGSYGFGASQWGCLDSLWTGESGWNWSARNPSSGAYGIPQALPAYKMGSVAGDWLVDPTTQIAWGLGYIRSAYGSPCVAWSTWLSRSPHWY